MYMHVAGASYKCHQLHKMQVCWGPESKEMRISVGLHWI